MDTGGNESGHEVTGRPGERTFAAIALALLAAAGTALAGDYPREGIIDMAVGPDEAAVNVSLTNNRWPDCTTLESAVADIFRIEGVADREKATDQDRALALWKWFRILASSTGGGYAYEGPPGKQRIVYDPHKILTVYGHHQCDGLSWAMVPLWRAAGHMAFDECTHGHTIAALRYRDADGISRYHDFDPQGRIYYWDEKAGRVGTWTNPVMTGRVYRHVLAPQKVHSLRTSLRIGEYIGRKCVNPGIIVPGGGTREPYSKDDYYKFELGKTKGVYAVAGVAAQRFLLARVPKLLAQQLYEGSSSFTVTDVERERLFPVVKGVLGEVKNQHTPLIHPTKAGEPCEFVFRLPPPYVTYAVLLGGTVYTAGDGDEASISISRDGGPWQQVFEKTKAGTEGVKLRLGPDARQVGIPDLYTAYDIRVKVRLLAKSKPTDAGVTGMSMIVQRMLNKRTLPNLMPGENVFRVNADRLAEGWAIKLTVEYTLKGETKFSQHVIGSVPYYFRIDAPDVTLRKIANYDQDFGNEDVRMVGYEMKLLPAGAAVPPGLESEFLFGTTIPRGGFKPTVSLPAKESEAAFAKACPYPADMTHRKAVKTPETDPVQTSGFFPQSKERKPADDRMRELIAQLEASGDSSYAAWNAAQELGAYPDAAEVLIKRLATSNIDLTLFICKALAQIADKRAVEPLLKKWEMVPKGAPGTRYVPDALAAIGDRRAVKPLIAKLPMVRFDYRFHIAHALGVLGGPEAEAALKDLAENDPFPAVREEAKVSLEELRK